MGVVARIDTSPLRIIACQEHRNMQGKYRQVGPHFPNKMDSKLLVQDAAGGVMGRS